MGRKGSKINYYGLYDTKDNELCIGIFTVNEIVEQFQTTKDSFYCMASRKQLMKGRYEIVKVEVEDV